MLPPYNFGYPCPEPSSPHTLPPRLQTARLRLCVEPETTQAIQGAIEQYGSAGAAFIGASAADLQGLASRQTPPLGEVMARLVLASD